MQTIGKKGEDAAVLYLTRKNYKVLERNYRFQKSEIDLICLQNDTLVFVEVKTRSSSMFGYPESFVSDNQKQSIIRGAEEYMHQNAWEGDIRFDVVSIIKQADIMEVIHFLDAFY